ncbi:MAG: helix-turn-helix domain-containing protein [Bacteroidota bacterium]|nr:helix-turn-helix domain-containing protein [Bacteroidota bacterium]
MLNIGSKITELRKAKKMSQAELANAVGASRDIIGKYERNDNLPSIEMALKLANVFDVSVDYLLGEGQHASYDKETIKRLQEIQDMKPDFRVHLFSVIDSVIRDYKTQQAYSS